MGTFFLQDRRQQGHCRPPEVSQPVPPGDPLGDSPVPSSPVRDIVITERDAQLGDLHRASAMSLEAWREP